MTTIVTRAGKGSPLTHTEVDTNFTNLNTNKLETAAIPLGTLAAPSISFVGDANTGAYSPGADTLAFVTAGSNRVHITSAGLVGIGTSTAQLSIGAVGGNVLHLAGAGTTGVRVQNTSGNSVDIYAGTDGFINQSGSGTLNFQLAGSTKATLTSTGLGIGTSSPADVLDTAAGNYRGITIKCGTTAHRPTLSFFNTTDSLAAYIQATGSSLAFGTMATDYGSHSEKVRIDSSGRLLVGTTSGTGDALLAVQGRQSDAARGGILQLRRGQAASALSAGDDIGAIRFSDNTSGNTGFAEILCASDGASGASDFPGRLVFSTTADGGSSPTERMRITSGDSNGGHFLFNCTSFPSASVKGIGIAPNSSFGNYFACATSSTGNYEHFEFFNPNGLVGSIKTNGSATSYNTSSDYRLKENVAPVTDGIARLQQLKPSRFNFIADPDTTFDGFIAHEAQAIVPECVTGEKDAVDDDGNPKHQGIDQSKLVPLLTAALQEAIANIESLEARLTAAGL